MTLAGGHGPLSHAPAGRFDPPLPGPVTFVEPLLLRVRAVRSGATVVDSERAVLVHRPGEVPAYAFPPADVEGVATAPEPAAPGLVGVAWDAADAWYEEEQEVRGHPKNPYHRVDCLPGHRRLRVVLGGVVLVDTDETTGVYETSLAPRLYVDRAHVRMDLLSPSTTTTWCNYKGAASYWSATVDGRVVEDVAWSYEDPRPESLPLAGLLSFDEARADVIAAVLRPG